MKRLLLAIPFLFAGFASAEPWCMSEDKIDTVKDGMAMELIAQASSPEDYEVEWYVNPKGHWLVIYTITKTTPPLICIVAHGDEFRLNMLDQPPSIDI